MQKQIPAALPGQEQGRRGAQATMIKVRPVRKLGSGGRPVFFLEVAVSARWRGEVVRHEASPWTVVGKLKLNGPLDRRLIVREGHYVRKACREIARI